MSASRLTTAYPAAPAYAASENVAGIEVPDPYRGLEDNSPEVMNWDGTQREFATEHVRGWGGRARLRERLSTLRASRFPAVPRPVGRRWMRVEPAAHPLCLPVTVSDEPYGSGDRVDLDLAGLGPAATTTVSWMVPSPDGAVIALGVCSDGSEHNSIALFDGTTGARLTTPRLPRLHDNWTGGISWVPGTSTFFFTGLLGPAHEFRQGVFRYNLDGHRLEPQSIPNADEHDYTMIQVSTEGRWAVAVRRIPDPCPVAVCDLRQSAPRWRPFVTDVTETVAGHPIKDMYVAVTEHGASRGRLVAIPFDLDDPNDSRRWTELIPEREEVLRTVAEVGDFLYLTVLTGWGSKLIVCDPTGRVVGDVGLPAGTVHESVLRMQSIANPGYPREIVFAHTTVTESWAVYRHRPLETNAEVVRAPATTIDASVTERVAVSTGGVKVPYQILGRVHGRRGPLPVLLTAYGGFNAPQQLKYPFDTAPFVEAGGLLVQAQIRGGGDFGRDWWLSGRRQHKRNGYADLYAVAEELIARGITTKEQLALTGSSNGGLLCGVALTERPELWRVVVPRVPLLDLVGALRHPYGAYTVGLEFADPTESSEAERMLTFSPYHMVRDGISYPAVYIDAGTTDPRCPPWHARKFAARLQAAQSGKDPILLNTRHGAGHGWATASAIDLEQNTDWLAFIFMGLGMTIHESASGQAQEGTHE